MKGTGVSLTAENTHAQREDLSSWLGFLNKLFTSVHFLMSLSPSCSAVMRQRLSFTAVLNPPSLSCPVVLSLEDWSCTFVCVCVCVSHPCPSVVHFSATLMLFTEVTVVKKKKTMIIVHIVFLVFFSSSK